MSASNTASQPAIKTICQHFMLCTECGDKRLVEFLDKPAVKVRLSQFLNQKFLRTNYKTRNGQKTLIRFDGLTVKSAAELFAYQGYLGNVIHSKL